MNSTDDPAQLHQVAVWSSNLAVAWCVGGLGRRLPEAVASEATA
jgi:hypothetical protein